MLRLAHLSTLKKVLFKTVHPCRPRNQSRSRRWPMRGVLRGSLEVVQTSPLNLPTTTRPATCRPNKKTQGTDWISANKKSSLPPLVRVQEQLCQSKWLTWIAWSRSARNNQPRRSERNKPTRLKSSARFIRTDSYDKASPLKGKTKFWTVSCSCSRAIKSCPMKQSFRNSRASRLQTCAMKILRTSKISSP